MSFDPILASSRASVSSDLCMQNSDYLVRSASSFRQTSSDGGTVLKARLTTAAGASSRLCGEVTKPGSPKVQPSLSGLSNCSAERDGEREARFLMFSRRGSTHRLSSGHCGEPTPAEMATWREVRVPDGGLPICSSCWIWKLICLSGNGVWVRGQTLSVWTC